jgi:hypothetical protein
VWIQRKKMLSETPGRIEIFCFVTVGHATGKDKGDNYI